MSGVLPLQGGALRDVVRSQVRSRLRGRRLPPHVPTLEDAFQAVMEALLVRAGRGWFDGESRVSAAARIRHAVNLDLRRLLDVRPGRRCDALDHRIAEDAEASGPWVERMAGHVPGPEGALLRGRELDRIVSVFAALLDACTPSQRVCFLAVFAPQLLRIHHLEAASAARRGGSRVPGRPADVVLDDVRRAVAAREHVGAGWAQTTAMLLCKPSGTAAVSDEDAMRWNEAVQRNARRARDAMRRAALECAELRQFLPPDGLRQSS